MSGGSSRRHGIIGAMQKRSSKGKLSRGMGCLSVACSLAFWIWATLFLFTPLNRSDVWLQVGVGAGAGLLWLTLWALGLLLGVLAASWGSRRWAWAAVLAVASYLAAVGAMSTVEW